MLHVAVFDMPSLSGSLVLPKPKQLYSKYTRRLERLLRCCDRLEQLTATKCVLKTDCDLIYEATFLSGVAALEHFLETFLIECVCGTPCRVQGHYALISPKSRACFERILLGSSGYARMLPYNEALSTACLYLNEGLPLRSLSEQLKGSLNEGTLIRNAIAHRSAKAVKAFRDRVPGVSSLPKNRQQPGPFLRAVFRRNPTQRRIDHYFASFSRTANHLASNW